MANVSDYFEDGKFTIWSFYAYLIEHDLYILSLKRAHEFEQKTIHQAKAASLYEEPANLPQLQETLASLRSARDNEQDYSATQLKRVSQAVLFHTDPKHHSRVKSDFPSQEEIMRLKLQVPLLTLMDTPATTISASRSKAHCPLHNEKTPSFTIYHDDNHYFCFGCQEGGDNLKFLMKLKNMTFMEAINHLRRYV